MSKKSTNNIPGILTLQIDALRLILKENLGARDKRDAWIAPLGLLVTLVSTSLVSDFSNRFGLKAAQWQTLAYVSIFACLIWLSRAAYSSFKVPTLEQVMSRIYDKSLTRVRSRAVLFLKARDQSGVQRFLVYYDELWQCYFCPHVHMPDDTPQLEADITTVVTNTLSVDPRSLHLSYIDRGDLQSTKKSAATQEMTYYYFYFYHAKIDFPFDESFSSLKFTLQNMTYRWVTIDEVMSHKITLERNAEVYRHIKDNFLDFFDQRVPMSISHIIC